jgi:general stress protein 26
MSGHAEEVRHVAELVDRARIGMFTTMTESGKHVSRPMALQEVEFDGDLWFFCYDDSAKAAQIRSQPEVNVSFANDKQSEWTSLSGKAEVVYDRQQAERLWAAPVEGLVPRRARHQRAKPDQGAPRLRGVLGVTVEQGAPADRRGVGSGDRRPGQVPCHQPVGGSLAGRHDQQRIAPPPLLHTTALDSRRPGPGIETRPRTMIKSPFAGA